MSQLRIRMALVAALLAMALGGTQFSSVSARPTSPSTFKLPLAAPDQTVTVTQGSSMPPGPPTFWDHNPGTKQQYAFDFAVGQNHFVVAAAQGGTVLGVSDTSDIQCSSANWESSPTNARLDGCWAHANFIVIADDDGSAALYMHLQQASAQVRVGQRVIQGQALALAGTTGWSTGVHLHFQVEALPTTPQDPFTGWWFTVSKRVSFSDPMVLAKDRDGIPLTGQQFSLPGASGVRPGGMWISPADGQVVGDTIHFAAHAYPTKPSDPAIQLVNFTIGTQNSWIVACQVLTAQASGDIFSCDVRLDSLKVPSGHVQVSFDVYDEAGNVNSAPNGVHTVTYVPPLFSDPLTSNARGWISDGTTSFFRSDGFHMKQFAGTGAIFISAPYSNPATYHSTITVTAKQILGTSAVPYVLTLGECPNCYEFGVTTAGYWSLSNTVPKGGQNYFTFYLVAPTHSSAIRTGLNATNTLQVHAAGGHFDFFINGVRVGSVNDQSHTFATVGLAFDDPRTLPTSGWVEDVFSNLTVVPN